MSLLTDLLKSTSKTPITVKPDVVTTNAVTTTKKAHDEVIFDIESFDLVLPDPRSLSRNPFLYGLDFSGRIFKPPALKVNPPMKQTRVWPELAVIGHKTDMSTVVAPPNHYLEKDEIFPLFSKNGVTLNLERRTIDRKNGGNPSCYATLVLLIDNVRVWSHYASLTYVNNPNHWPGSQFQGERQIGTFDVKLSKFMGPEALIYTKLKAMRKSKAKSYENHQGTANYMKQRLDTIDKVIDDVATAHQIRKEQYNAEQKRYRDSLKVVKKPTTKPSATRSKNLLDNTGEVIRDSSI